MEREFILLEFRMINSIFIEISIFFISIDTIFSFDLFKLFGFKWIEEEFTFFEFGKGKEKV